MIYLSLSALKYAANICEELPKYKIGVALLDMSDSKSIIDILKKNIKDTGVKIVISKYNSIIEFSNGSSIKVLRPCEKVDYYKTHNIDVELNKKDDANEM